MKRGVKRGRNKSDVSKGEKRSKKQKKSLEESTGLVDVDEEDPMYLDKMGSFVDGLKESGDGEEGFDGEEFDDADFERLSHGETVKKSKKGSWRKVELPESFFMGLKDGGFMGLEELDEKEYFDLEKKKMKKKKSKKEEKSEKKQDKKKKKKQPIIEEEDEDEDEEKAVAESEQEEEDEEQKEEEEIEQSKVVDKKKRREEKEMERIKKQIKPFADDPKEQEAVASVVDAWSNFDLATKVLAGVRSLHFEKPTPVQERVLPAAISAGKDIIAAAETGSGKTLAYSIPVVNSIILGKLAAGTTANDSMKALILTPTRELAIQVADHIRAFTHELPIRVAAIVGGMSIEKQERIIRQCPDIVVATTGRLWELISEQSNDYLANVSDLQSFVLDEADRMIEVGHFQELDDINRMIRSRCHTKLQTFVLSATLSVSTRSHRVLGKAIEVDDIREEKEAEKLRREERLRKKKLGEKADTETPLDQVLAAVEFRRKVEIIDLTNVHVTVKGLFEYKLMCPDEEKDNYLYWILRTIQDVPALHGRSIVFTNSINMTKRLVSLLRILHICTTRLHAGMQQRQRLRALDHFRTHDTCVLIASDVAARGLDIPEVSYVIHFGSPRTSDVYVHRSGRTARAGKRGVSICIVGPKEVPQFRDLTNSMGKENMSKYKGLESLAVLADDPEEVFSYSKKVVALSRISPMMKTAQALDRELRLAAADVRKRNWLTTMAKGLLEEDDDENGEGEEEEEEEAQSVSKKSAKKGKKEEEESKKSSKKNRDMIQKLSVDKEIADMKLVMSALAEDDDDSDEEGGRKRKKGGKLSNLVSVDDDDLVAQKRAQLQSWKLMIADMREKLTRQLSELTTPNLSNVLQSVSGTGGFGKRAVPIGSGMELSSLDQAIADARARHNSLTTLQSKNNARYGSGKKGASKMRQDLDAKIRPRKHFNKHMKRRLCRFL